MDYSEEAKEIWNLYVPKSGQANTVQGELLRAVEKLRWEAQNNGNGNWDIGFEILLQYLGMKLIDYRVFSVEQINKINHILARLKRENPPYLEDDYFDYLSDRVVDYFNFYGTQSHEENLRLYR